MYRKNSSKIVNCLFYFIGMCFTYWLVYYLVIENWVFVDRDDTRCKDDCQNGTTTEVYKCKTLSCQGINDYFSSASNGSIEVVERKGLCNQQAICQSKCLLHCVKSVQILCISPYWVRIRENTPYLDTFHAVLNAPKYVSNSNLAKNCSRLFNTKFWELFFVVDVDISLS